MTETSDDATVGDFSAHPLRLRVVEGSFAICKLPFDSPIPYWATQGELFSVTRTADELSVVCREVQVPDGIDSAKAWRCLRVAGSMPFTMVGVLSSMTAPLAAAGISVFAISTFDTDYLLVKAHDFERAIGVLLAAGHEINDTDDVG